MTFPPLPAQEHQNQPLVIRPSFAWLCCNQLPLLPRRLHKRIVLHIYFHYELICILKWQKLGRHKHSQVVFFLIKLWPGLFLKCYFLYVVKSLRYNKNMMSPAHPPTVYFQSGKKKFPDSSHKIKSLKISPLACFNTDLSKPCCCSAPDKSWEPF